MTCPRCAGVFKRVFATLLKYKCMTPVFFLRAVVMLCLISPLLHFHNSYMSHDSTGRIFVLKMWDIHLFSQ